MVNISLVLVGDNCTGAADMRITKEQYQVIRVILIMVMVFTLYVMSVAYITYLREYGGVYRVEAKLEQKEFEYNLLNSEYNSCVDHIRGRESSLNTE